MSGMRERFLVWADRHQVSVSTGSSVEQICDALIAANVEWPEPLTNDEGWHLWTARIRKEMQARAIGWEEVSATNEIEVTLRLTDSRSFSVRRDEASLKAMGFGTALKGLEADFWEQIEADDKRRDAILAASDKQFEETVPDLFEYALGFRAWDLQNGILRPIGAGTAIWDGGNEVRATCGKGVVHRAPDQNCECGLYAWHSFENMMNDAMNSGARENRVWGAVVARGRLEVHRDGFRAEYMRPVMLGYNPTVTDEDENGVTYPDRERVRGVAAKLGGIPVFKYEDIETKAQTQGRLVPKELRP